MELIYICELYIDLDRFTLHLTVLFFRWTWPHVTITTPIECILWFNIKLDANLKKHMTDIFSQGIISRLYHYLVPNVNGGHITECSFYTLLFNYLFVCYRSSIFGGYKE